MKQHASNNSAKRVFEGAFIVVSIVALFATLGMISFFTRQFDVSAKKDVVPEQESTLGSKASPTNDPFITRGEGAEDLLLRPIVDGRDPQMGPNDAKVTIVEFSDFSCEFCAEQDRVVKEVVEKYKDKVRLVWKDVPDVGSISYEAALAARCAQEQNKFWSVHDFLFSGEESFSAPLSKVVESTGLDAASFMSCFASNRYEKDIVRNIKEASALRLPGVPFFFVGDQEYLGAIDKEDLERVIEKGLYEQQD